MMMVVAVAVAPERCVTVSMTPPVGSCARRIFWPSEVGPWTLGAIGGACYKCRIFSVGHHCMFSGVYSVVVVLWVC